MVPKTPDQARLAYTAVGPSLVGVGEQDMGSTFALSAAPNPVVGKATLRFSLAEKAAVELGIYDIAGRLVRRLQKRMMDAGAYSNGWDLRSEDGQLVRSGLYFARLRAGSRDETTRLTVLR